ncbi:MAG: ligase-associated DNA damage response exonuclease [Methylovirgula sp.]|jgi:putative mRNA 3-end processing factor
MTAADCLSLTPAGLYCKAGDFYVDPLRPVPRALITHGHSDHARPGHGKVLATKETLAIMAIRCGADFAKETQAIAYGESLRLGDANVSFHPAGHVLGSAQILIEHRGQRIVVSGDYKRQSDPTCAPFEPVVCHCFITEATFGLPVFRHPNAEVEIAKLLASLQLFPERSHLVGAYALGKAQRIIALLRGAGYARPIFLHGSLAELTHYYESTGIALGELRPLAGVKPAKIAGEIVLCPPMALESLALRGETEPRKVFASGWMRVRARARQRGIELPLIISDHADWDDLCRTVLETGCEELLVTHGEADALVYWGEGRGLAARPLHLMGYGDEESENGEAPE